MTGPIDLGQTLNNISGDMLGLGMLLMIWLAVFSASRTTSFAQSSLMAATFAAMVVSILLFGAGWVGQEIVIFLIIGTIGSAFLTKGANL